MPDFGQKAVGNAIHRLVQNDVRTVVLNLGSQNRIHSPVAAETSDHRTQQWLEMAGCRMRAEAPKTFDETPRCTARLGLGFHGGTVFASPRLLKDLVIDSNVPCFMSELSEIAGIEGSKAEETVVPQLQEFVIGLRLRLRQLRIEPLLKLGMVVINNEESHDIPARRALRFETANQQAFFGRQHTFDLHSKELQ